MLLLFSEHVVCKLWYNSYFSFPVAFTSSCIHCYGRPWYRSEKLWCRCLARLSVMPSCCVKEIITRSVRLPASYAGLMNTSTHQCCTSFFTSQCGNIQHVSSHRSSPKLAHTCWCLWASTSMAHISMSNMVRHGTCRHKYSVERGLVISFCGHHSSVTDPTIWQPGFCLPRHTWSLLNHFWTGHVPCCANLHKWGLAQSSSCDCGQRQTMDHIVDMCPLTNFEGGLKLLHEADDDAVMWLESIATTALTKWTLKF